MTRIGFLTSTRTFGGAERETIALARHLVSRGLHVTLFEAGHDQYSSRDALTRGLTLVSAPAPANLSPREWQALFRRSAVSTLVVVKGNFVKRWLSLDLALILAGRRAVAVEHGWPPAPPARSSTRQPNRLLPSTGLWYRGQRAALAIHRRALTHVITVSHAVRARLIGDFGFAPERVSVVPTGIDTDRFRFIAADRAALRQEWGVPESRFVFGYLGRLGNEKRVDRLLRAFRQVRDHSLGTAPLLVLVGEGPRQAELRALAADLGVLGECLFAGPTAEPWKVYSAIDCAVSAGDQEGLGCALLEAAASERPVVTVAAAGAKETVRDGVTGFLAAADETALAQSMIRVVALHPWQRERLGAAGRAHVMAHHDQQRQLDLAAGLIESAGRSKQP